MILSKYYPPLILIFLAAAAAYSGSNRANELSSPVSSLNLRLWGTITGNNVNTYAIIEDMISRKQKLYKKGDGIQNATVETIYREKVVIKIGETFEVLEIESSRPAVDADDNNGIAALIDASLKGNMESVELLILEGANLDARDRLGDTALMNAALKGHLEIVELLISNGADASLKDNSGNTALIDSAKYTRDSACEIMTLLVDNGVDVNAKNKLGLTALIFAAQGGHVENIGCLIDAGADVNAKSKSGETALKFAEMSNRKDIIDLLKDNGANE